ncbi:MAG: zinc-binding dehydrogenase [Promethearchaeota archaeon]
MENMLAAVFHKNKTEGGQIKLEEVDAPQIYKNDQVLIEVISCGICGTDLKILSGSHPAKDNIILGHEFVGIVKEIGEEIQDLSIGDKVAVDPNEKCGYCMYCRKGLPNLCEYMATGTTFGIFQDGGFAKYCVLPRNSLFKLPNDINMSSVALIEPLSCAIHCHNIADVKDSDNVMIIGAGPMGLLIQSILRTHPLKSLISMEINEWRIQKAEELGADHVINPVNQDFKTKIMSITDSKGIDVIIDAVGLTETFEIAQKVWAHGAKLVCLGQDTYAEAKIRPNNIVRYQRKILGSYIYTSKDFLDAIELISNNKLKFNELITQEIPLNDLISIGFRLMREKKCIKIITHP